MKPVVAPTLRKGAMPGGSEIPGARFGGYGCAPGSGNVEFTDDDHDVKSVPPGGWFRLENKGRRTAVMRCGPMAPEPLRVVISRTGGSRR
jgi:hypothetical protein